MEVELMKCFVDFITKQGVVLNQIQSEVSSRVNNVESDEKSFLLNLGKLHMELIHLNRDTIREMVSKMKMAAILGCQQQGPRDLISNNDFLRQPSQAISFLNNVVDKGEKAKVEVQEGFNGAYRHIKYDSTPQQKPQMQSFFSVSSNTSTRDLEPSSPFNTTLPPCPAERNESGIFLDNENPPTNTPNYKHSQSTPNSSSSKPNYRDNFHKSKSDFDMHPNSTTSPYHGHNGTQSCLTTKDSTECYYNFIKTNITGDWYCFDRICLGLSDADIHHIHHKYPNNMNAQKMEKLKTWAFEKNFTTIAILEEGLQKVLELWRTKMNT